MEYHVSKAGSDKNEGSIRSDSPFPGPIEGLKQGKHIIHQSLFLL